MEVKIIVSEVSGTLMAVFPNGDVKPILVDSAELQTYGLLKVELQQKRDTL